MADEIQETRCALCQPKVSADCFPGWAGGKIVKILNWNLIGLAPQKIKKDEPHCQIYFLSSQHQSHFHQVVSGVLGGILNHHITQPLCDHTGIEALAV